MDWIHVRLDGPGGIAVEQQLKSVYISGMDFEPEERRQRILPMVCWKFITGKVRIWYTPK